MQINLISEVAKNQKIYKHFLKIADEQFLSSILKILHKTPWKDGVSNKSLTFGNGDTFEILEKVFCLGDTFQSKFEQAVSDNGLEKQRINRVHSSALLALLTFYSVSKEKPITINLGDKEIVFTNVAFEHKNLVGKDKQKTDHKSNIDITLYDGDILKSSNNILFLESKFSEYLALGQKKGISNELYKDIYNQIFPSSTNTESPISKKLENNKIVLTTNDKHHHYCEGIKQMISHYMGVLDFIQPSKCSNVYLGCILFDFEDDTIDTKIKGTDISLMEDYKQIYSGLCKKLNELTGPYAKPKNLHILNDCLTYQEVFRLKQNREFLDRNVKTFYSL